ncbi:MAG: hypothetical protein ACLFU7_13245 [Armatimonadota bacterium]
MMGKTVDDVRSRDITDLDFVTEVRPGVIEVDVDRMKSALAARGLNPSVGARLKASGIVKTDFEIDQSLYEDGRYE